MIDPLAVLKLVADSSAQLSTTALAVFGGSVAAVVGTSYRRPDARWWRVPALLFAPGWLCLAMSLFLGNTISGRYLASTMVGAPKVQSIAERINDDYACQRGWFLASLVFFGVWLLISLYYWVFVETTKKETA